MNWLFRIIKKARVWWGAIEQTSPKTAEKIEDKVEDFIEDRITDRK